MPGRALARGPISLILADSSWSRAGSTLKVVTRAYMGVPSLFWHARAMRRSEDRTPQPRRQRRAWRAAALLDVRRRSRVVCVRLRLESGAATGMLPASADVVVVGGGNAALCAALAAARAWRVRARARARAGRGGRRQQPLHRRRHALRLRRRRRPQGADARPDRGRDRAAPTSAPTPRTSSSTTCAASPSTAPTPSCARSWSSAAARRCAGCAARACASRRSRAARPSRSTASSSSGAASPSRAWGGGPGLVDALTTGAPRRTASRSLYDARAVALDRRRRRRAAACACGTRASTGSRSRAQGVVLACGGFQANAEMAHALSRARAGSSPRCAARASTPATASTWRSTSAPCRPATGRAGHAVGWDRNAPEFGDLAVGDNFQKHSYPFGIMVNANGERFVDEGADFRNYTYAKYGRVILSQPRQFAWQVFDKQGAAPAARRIPHQARHQGVGQHARGAGRASSRASMPARRSRRSRPTTRR